MSSAPALAGTGVSGRECEVLPVLGEHLSHAEIAARWLISVRPVESQRLASVGLDAAADGSSA